MCASRRTINLVGHRLIGVRRLGPTGLVMTCQADNIVGGAEADTTRCGIGLETIQFEELDILTSGLPNMRVVAGGAFHHVIDQRDRRFDA